MRKARCSTCLYGKPEWIVFDSVVICDVCRWHVVSWFHDSEDFCLSHPFVDEFMGGVSGPPSKVSPIPSNNA
jgi:hypothetical protein